MSFTLNADEHPSSRISSTQSRIDLVFSDTEDPSLLASPRSYFPSSPSVDLGIDDSVSVTPTLIDDPDTRSGKSHKPFEKRSFRIGLGSGALLFTAAATPYFALSTTKSHCDVRVEHTAESWMNKCGTVGRSLSVSERDSIREQVGVNTDIEVVDMAMDER
ncbi:hypothetical protein IAR50_006676 [Cryptococcus sp. DSM 104548]